MLKYFNPLAWGRWFAQFVYFWTLSIPWRDAPKAIPVMILMVVLLITGTIAWSDGSNWRTRLMNNQLATAWEDDDFATAELVLRRQLRRTPDDGEMIFRLALARSAQEADEEAIDLMRQLVSVKGHEQAARWLLQELYVSKAWADFDDQQRSEFGSLLELVHRQAPKDIPIKKLYADYLVTVEKYAQAIPLLEELSWSQPMRGLQAATLARRLENFVMADRLAERTLESVNKLAEEDPTNTMLSLAVAQNQMFLNRFPEAVRTLDRAVGRAKDEQAKRLLNQGMGETLVRWVNFIEESPSTTSKEKLRVLRMLQVALQYAPNNPRVLTLVADKVLSTHADNDEELQVVRRALIEGSSPGIAHFIRGTAALLDDDVDTAMMHLKIAAELMPNSSAILNNLAVALTTREDAPLEKALQLVDAAIKQSPNATPHYYETRGQILYRLARHLEAIPDLERALAQPELAKKAHETLALCYEQLGQTELSEEHRQAANPEPDKATEEDAKD